MGDRVPLSVPSLGAQEAAYLTACIDEGWVARGGRFVREFETLFAKIAGVDHAVSTVSGSAALHLALVDLHVSSGDEVIVPALTFIATAAPVAYVGATPVFVDVDPATYCIDPAAIEAAITPRTRAIIPVHLYGHPADLDPIRALADPREIPIVEDATEALGSYCRGRACGTLGTIGAFSFNGNKVITSGGGGMLLADTGARVDHLRHLTLQARVGGTVEYLHDEVGFNYAMSNLNAAVGLAQLKRLEEFVEARRALARRYAEGLAPVDDLTFCKEAPWARCNFWLMSVLVDERVRGRNRTDLMRTLDESGVDSRPFFHPLNRLKPFRALEGAPTPVADRLHSQGLSIPSSANLGRDDQERIITLLGG